MRSILLRTVATRLPRTQPTLHRRFQYSFFHSEADFHDAADETLETIQEVLDQVLEDNFENNKNDTEVSLANGVLTLALPPHGTWVINKQAPNRQLWWSSPLSGPKRFEFIDNYTWCATAKDGLALGPLLVQEIRQVYPGIEKFEIKI